MDLDSIMPSGGNQTEKDRYHDLTYIWNLKKKTTPEQMNKPNKTKTGPETEDRLSVAGGRGWGMGEKVKKNKRYTVAFLFFLFVLKKTS